MATEKWERLNNEHGLYVTKEHGFSTDTLLLADFSMPKKTEICADFGTGAGAIAFIWKMRANPKMIYGVELQENAFMLAKKSLVRNGFDGLELIHGDVRERPLPNESLDLIACNPPYKAKTAGLKNPSEAKRLARHEESLTIEELTEAALYALKFGGRLCLCQRPERLTDVLTAMRKNRIEPKRLRLVQQRAGSKPMLALIEGRKNGRSGLVAEPTLIIEDENGYTSEMKAVYGDYYLGDGNEGD